MIVKDKEYNCEEMFMPIPDFTNYIIGIDGTKIISFKRYKQGKLLSFTSDKDGYKRVVLYQDGKPFYRAIHRLVALTFIENPDNLPEVNHKDGNKENNHIDNLEWCTGEQNKEHAHKNGLHDYSKFSGINHYNTKLTKEDVLKIRELAKKEFTYSEIAKQFDTSKAAIGRIVLKQTYKNI